MLGRALRAVAPPSDLVALERGDLDIGDGARVAGVDHFGNDYIVDGATTSPCDEDAQPDPLGAYRRSKLRGEEML